jgi:hypothetical protein
MASSGNKYQSRRIKTKASLKFDETDSSFQVDSGIGDSLVDSLQSIPSDRSNTDSYSCEDESSVYDSMELAKETAKLDINSDNKNNENCPSVDQGYNSISVQSVEEQDAPPEPTPVPPKEDIRPYRNVAAYVQTVQTVQSYFQTGDVRYLLAPYLPMLLHQNDDGDTYVFLHKY